MNINRLMEGCNRAENNAVASLASATTSPARVPAQLSKSLHKVNCPEKENPSTLKGQQRMAAKNGSNRTFCLLQGHLIAGVMPNTCTVAAIRAQGQSLKELPSTLVTRMAATPPSACRKGPARVTWLQV